MKINFKLFSKNKSSLSDFSKVGSGYPMSPVRDWTSGLLVATLCFLVGVIFIAFDFYTQINQANNTEVTVESKPVTYKERDVIRYAEFYAEKASTFNKLREERAYITPVIESEVVKPENSGETALPLAPEPEGQYTDPVPAPAQ